MPRFNQAGRFTGETESASRWLKKIRLDLASSDSKYIPTYMYIRAIDALLDGPAAYWCDSVPAIKHILENYDTANSADARWLEDELIKQFPGEIVDSPIERITVRTRSYSFDMNADPESAAIMLEELSIGERTKRWSQKSEPASNIRGECQGRNYRSYRRDTPHKVREGKIIDEYQFYNTPKLSSSKHYNNQCDRPTKEAKTMPALRTRSIDRPQIPMTPRSILKKSASHYPQPSVHACKDQERGKDRYSAVRNPPHFQDNRLYSQYRSFETPRSRASHTHHAKSTSSASELRSRYQSSRARFRDVTIVQPEPQRRYWSYLPLVTEITRHPVGTSAQHKERSIPYYTRSAKNSSAWKTSNSAIDALEQRRRASKSSSRIPVLQKKTTHPIKTRNGDISGG
ncbi:hypothetical protein EYC80_006566 [Monilinia laxa]|uniref:Uncharacterized protein n=1 Tax=Monilinia laxa TaxID=61186 RepID=A0A5N6JUV7_MONLA|nr:hypothetical protein EYC80_006566 [Monilinia laxa]